jgi:hypothetical protein
MMGSIIPLIVRYHAEVHPGPGAPRARALKWQRATAELSR